MQTHRTQWTRDQPDIEAYTRQKTTETDTYALPLPFVFVVLVCMFCFPFCVFFVEFHCVLFLTMHVGKAIPLQTLTGPEVSRKLRLQNFKTIGT
jgi:hypothetical protein